MSKLNGMYTIDAWHSSVNFSARHIMISKVRGVFGTFTGSALIASNDGNLSFEIDVKSVDTKNIERDDHLRGPDFFDAGRFPKITFTSDEIIVHTTERVEVQGELTIKDVTKPLNLIFLVSSESKDNFDNVRVGFESDFILHRSQFGLNWNAPLSIGGVLISDEISIELDFSTIKS